MASAKEKEILPTDICKGSSNPDLQALMNLSESVGGGTLKDEVKQQSPWNFNQNQTVFKPPMGDPPPVQRLAPSAEITKPTEPEFRIPAVPPRDLHRNIKEPVPITSPFKEPKNFVIAQNIEKDKTTESSGSSENTEQIDKDKADEVNETNAITDKKEGNVDKEEDISDRVEDTDKTEGNVEKAEDISDREEDKVEDRVEDTVENSNDSQIDRVKFTIEDGDDKEMVDNEGDKESPEEKKEETEGQEVESAQDEEGEDIKIARRVFEYQWPQEKNGEWCVLQEQVSEYLGVLSFKRKHPDLTRRPIEFKERIYLREKCVVTETQCDLGLTVLKSEEVLDLMMRDYNDKYHPFATVMHERERKRIEEQRKNYEQPNIEKEKMNAYMKKAIKSAAEFNAQFMRELREERRAYFDLQTQEVHYPQGRMKKVTAETSNPGAYPLALIPGQYANYHVKYTPQEKKYLPLSTALYSPPRTLTSIYADPDHVTEASEGEDKDKDTDDSSSSDSESDSESGESDEEADGGEESTEVEQTTDDNASVSSSRRGSRGGRGTPARTQRTPARATPKRNARTPRTRRTGVVSPEAKPEALSEGEARGVKAEDGGPLSMSDPLPKDCSDELTSNNSANSHQDEFLKFLTGELKREDPLAQCSVCQGTEEKGKDGQPETLVKCSECQSHGHPSCLELTDEMVPIIKTYPWQCMECKTCVKCMDSQDEDKMMFCDLCDRGYHTFCVGLRCIPTGRWECPGCQTEDQPPKKRGRQR